MTDDQLSAVAGLWDATEHYAIDDEYSATRDRDEMRAILVDARARIEKAFPLSHPIYDVEFYEAPEVSK